MASAKAQESLREFAKDAGEAEKALGPCSKESKQEGKTCCELGEAKLSGTSQGFSGAKLLSPGVLNEKKAQIPLSPKSKAIASDADGHVYIVGAEIPPEHIGASKHTEVFGEGVVTKFTQRSLDRILNIINTQSPMYEIKAGNMSCDPHGQMRPMPKYKRLSLILTGTPTSVARRLR